MLKPQCDIDIGWYTHVRILWTFVGAGRLSLSDELPEFEFHCPILIVNDQIHSY